MMISACVWQNPRLQTNQRGRKTKEGEATSQPNRRDTRSPEPRALLKSGNSAAGKEPGSWRNGKALHPLCAEASAPRDPYK